LSLCMGALALSASADVTTFMVEGSAACRYHGNGTIVTIPHGFTFTNKAGDTKCRTTNELDKTLVSNQVEIQSDRLRKSDRSFVTTEPITYTRCGQMFWYTGNNVRITPAAGTAITKIVVHTVNPGGNIPLNIVAVEDDKLVTKETFTKNESDTTQIWTGKRTEAFNLWQGSGTLTPTWIEVTTEGTSTQVDIPVVKKTLPIVGKNEKIELTCPTEGAQIYYTVTYTKDGKNESSKLMSTIADATLYTGPFSLEGDAVVRAIAVKDGMTNSFPIYQEYYVVDDYNFMAEFNFNDHTSMKDMDGNQIAVYSKYPVGVSSTEKVSIAERTIFDKDVMCSSDEASITLSNSFSGAIELRITKAKGKTCSVQAPADYYISAMMMVVGWTADGLGITSETPGTYAKSPHNAARKIYRNSDKDGFFAEFVTLNGDDEQRLDHLYVFLKSVDGSGVDGIEADLVDENAPVEYFNLQGVRVANPANGVFIKRQGHKATKVLVK
ncbi:MAG: chitobiase/beta-hexosaminidase C-terminal domain-containing protein, partial [Muribaculaceae bacterium]|nr:chitobiase/beta-hexosaminidase C-terminal domain-containing protein [Muribaculaceae bacterium]